MPTKTKSKSKKTTKKPATKKRVAKKKAVRKSRSKAIKSRIETQPKAEEARSGIEELVNPEEEANTITRPKSREQFSVRPVFVAPLLILIVLLVGVTMFSTGCSIVDTITNKLKGVNDNTNAVVTNDNVNDNANANVNKSVLDQVISSAEASNFAEYEQDTVSADPQIDSYTIDPDLGNIYNAEQVYLSDAAKELLIQNGFVVSEGNWDEFYSLYERNRMSNTPNFITTDSMLHNYHLAFDYLLRDLEKSKLYDELDSLTSSMLQASQAQYDQLKGTEWEDAARRNVAFYSVLNKILNPNASVPSYVQTEVTGELALIEEAGGLTLSKVMAIGNEASLREDYSQYIPRGHYTKSEELKKYFKAMMYCGRITFRLKFDDETKSAMLITLALTEDEDRFDSWDSLYEPTVFFVGKSDDITFYQYAKLMDEIYGSDQVNISGITSDDTKFDQFVAQAKELDPPLINSMPIGAANIDEDREETIMGFRFMGQRFTIDASVFQRLIYREVGDKEHVCASDPKEWANCGGSRCLPKGLDIPAAMGSEEALTILTGWGEADYACYTENMETMSTYLTGLDQDTWTQNLYWGWIYSLKPLVEVRGEGWPTFMQNTAWTHKSLNTYLGSWTELKHDTILYAKQVYAELGGGPQEDWDDRGYVEPNPEVYARLAALLKMTREGLQIRNLLSDENAEYLQTLETLATNLKEISEKELNGQALTDDDYELIRAYGGSLEHLWVEAFKDRDVTELSDEPSPIVADVATDPGGSVLEEGTGHIADIYVVFELEDKLRIAKGGVYTHYEFMWPLDDRLTDEAWRELLVSEDKPAMADWTQSFIAQETQ